MNNTSIVYQKNNKKLKYITDINVGDFFMYKGKLWFNFGYDGIFNATCIQNGNQHYFDFEKIEPVKVNIVVRPI